jgi:integrase
MGVKDLMENTVQSWYRALRACEIKARKFYATRHTFISDALSHGVNIKWLAEYCGSSVAMIEKHYGRYIKSDSEEQLQRVFERQTGTFAETQRSEPVREN